MRISNNTDQKCNKPSFSAIFRIKCDAITPDTIKPLAVDLLELSKKYNSKILAPQKIGSDYFVACEPKADMFTMFTISNFASKLGEDCRNVFKLESKKVDIFANTEYKNSGVDDLKEIYDSIK